MTPEFLILHAPDEAIPRIVADLIHDPDDVGALCQMARAQLAADRPGEALAAVERAVGLAPDQSYPHHLLSAVLSRLGRHDEAIEAARLSVRLEPHNPYRHDRATRALLDAGGPFGEAEESAQTALTLAPDEGDLWFSYALVLAASGRRGEARRALLHVLTLDPGHAGARQELSGTVTDIARGAAGLGGAVRNFLHLTSVLLAVLSVGGFRFAQNEHPSAARWTVLAAVLVPLALAGWFTARQSPATRRHLWPAVMNQLRASALTVVSAGLVVVALAGPDNWLSWLLGSAAVGGVLARVLTLGERAAGESAAGERAAGVKTAAERAAEKWVAGGTAAVVRAPGGIEIPYVLGTAVLALLTAACLILSIVCLIGGTTLAQPALTVAGVMLTVAGFATGRMIAKRGKIADSA